MKYKKELFIVLLSLIMLCGCHKINDVVNTTEEDNLTISEIIDEKLLNEFNKESIDSLLNYSKTIAYPNNVYFVPSYYDDENRIIGECSLDDAKDVFLAIYDLNDLSFNKVKKVDGTVGYSSVRVIYSDKDILIFEELDQKKQTSNIYLYKYVSKDLSNIRSAEGIPPITYAQCCYVNESVILNLYNPATNHYTNYLYTFNNDKIEALDESNCGYPVFVDNKLYYISINNEDCITKLIEYDFDEKKKKILYEISDEKSYISGLYSDGNKTYLTIFSDSKNNWFLLDLNNHRLEYEFTTEYTESIQFENGYLTWAGPTELEDRVRLEYFLFDTNNQIAYTNNNGMILLSNNGMICVTYKKEDKDIPKGGMYLNENTYLSNYWFDTNNSSSSSVEQENIVAESNTSKKVNISLKQSVQENEYFCSPACAQMVLHLHNIYMSQSEIASEMNTVPITGTEYIYFSKVINKYIFGKETISDNESGYRVQTISGKDYYSLFENRAKIDLDYGDPMFVAIEVSVLYPELNVSGNHMVVVSGYISDENGNITDYYIVDPSYLVQDEVYAGLKLVSAIELKNAMLKSEEPAYIW